MSDVYTVIIAPEAVIEVSEIAAWWNAHRRAAPRLFQIELDHAVLRLAERILALSARLPLAIEPRERAEVVPRTIVVGLLRRACRDLDCSCAPRCPDSRHR